MIPDPSLIAFISIVLALTIFLVTIINTDAAILLMIPSMLLSPEIRLGQLTDRAVVVRIEDLLLVVIFFTWLAKLAINKQLGLLRSTPLNVPIGLFILCCCVSTGMGLIRGTVTSLMGAVFYLLKYVEYFVMYFMVANVVKDRRQIQRFLTAMVATAMVVSLYAYWQILTLGVRFRVTTPFEGEAEPNTLAGYLIIMLAVCAGLALYTRSPARRLLLIGAIVVMLPVLVYTYSRGGYVAFLAMYLALCLFSMRHRLVLWTLLVFGVLLATTALPQTVSERIASTFDPRSAVQIGGLRLSASPAQRLLIWRVIFEKWKEHPLMGFGVTGVGFVDNQNALVLGELGIVGMLVYLWVRWRLLAISVRYFRRTDDPLVRGLSLGFFAALVGLLVHSLTGNIFIIVRIMEPFWFLAALMMVLPKLIEPAALPAIQQPPAALLAGAPHARG